MKTIHVASVSSGKDSQATMIIMMERVGKENCRFVMCDTGNEDPAVFEHLAYLENHFGIKIDILKANFDERIKAKRLFIARDQRKRPSKRQEDTVDEQSEAPGVGCTASNWESLPRSVFMEGSVSFS